MAKGHTVHGHESLLDTFPFKTVRGFRSSASVVFSVRSDSVLLDALSHIASQQGIPRNIVINNILSWGVGVYEHFCDLENVLRSE